MNLADIWLFISDQILGMKWFNSLIGKMLNSFGLRTDNPIGDSVQFFLYDTIKIVLLLCILIFVISYIQSYFPPERTKMILGRYKGVWANLMGALLGTVTPFCSCSSIPLFIGFTSAGLPIGVTFSFLISSPLVDLAAFVLLMSVFGPKVATLYVIVGIILSVVGGTIIEKCKMEKYIEDFVTHGKNVDIEPEELTKKDRAIFAYESMMFTFKKVFPYILGGVLIGAMIHNYIPEHIINEFIGKDNPFSVVIATLIGIPIYADVFGTIPIAEALYSKGVGIGTVLSFMMAVTALSLPSLVLLRRVVKPKLLFFFVLIVGVGIIIIGYSFNFILRLI